MAENSAPRLAWLCSRCYATPAAGSSDFEDDLGDTVCFAPTIGGVVRNRTVTNE